MKAETASVTIIDVDQHNDANRDISSTKTEVEAEVEVAAEAVPLEDLQNFRKRNWGLRLSVSNVAAMTGFHPFTSLPQLMLQLVYQSSIGQELLQHDCRLLGISLVTEEDMLLNIATKAGTAVRDSMKQAVEVQKGKLILKTNQDVVELNQRVLLEARKANQSDKKISENELAVLQKGVQQLLYRGYGSFHERQAIDMYESKCGWDIRERNTVMVKWPFIRSEDAPPQELDKIATSASFSSNPPIQGSQRTAVPLTCATKSEMKDYERPPSRKRLRSSHIQPIMEEALSAQVVDAIGEKETTLDTADTVSLQPAERPFFCLYGSVDGIRDELWYDEEHQRSKAEATIIDNGCDDDDEWKLRQVVIECKHRMKTLHSRLTTPVTPPPLYDQIQAVVYCLMYETTEADIIEVFRSHRDEYNNTNDNSNYRIDIATSRITLYDPIHRHGENWKSVILPRLRDFVEAVYTIRSDDGKRYQLLSSLASMDEDIAWKIILDECPWLKDCDTAYYRLQLSKT